MKRSSALHGWRLTLARTVCLVIVASSLFVFFLNVPLQFASYRSLCSAQPCATGQLTPDTLQQLQRSGLSVDWYAGYLTALNVGFVAVFVILAGLIFWRKSNDWMGIYAAGALVLFGVTFFSDYLTPLVTHYPGLVIPVRVLSVLGGATFNVFLYLFPDGRFVPRWTRWLVPLVVARETLTVFWPQLPFVDWLFYPYVASSVLAQVYRYWRVSNAAQRQQTKWVVFGLAIGAGGVLTTVLVVTAWVPDQASSGTSYLLGITAIFLFMLLIPLCIGIAILRSHLWDIDILIRRTLIYGVLTGLLALVYLGAVVALQTIFTALTGAARSELVTVLSTLVIAALFVPLRNRLQAAIDRRFYRRKYDAARTLAQFSGTLRDEVNLDDLSAHLLAAVDDTMQPESVALWLRATGGEGRTK